MNLPLAVGTGAGACAEVDMRHDGWDEAGAGTQGKAGMKVVEAVEIVEVAEVAEVAEVVEINGAAVVERVEIPSQALPGRAPQRALVLLPTPALTLEQACRLLKVLPTAAWEVVDAARRALVARAQPDLLRDLSTARCDALQDEARLVNQASQKLFEARLGKVPDAGAGAAASGDSQAD